MGGVLSREKTPPTSFNFLSAVASSLRLGWLGTANVETDMELCQIALFPHLVNIAAAQDDIAALEDHLQEGADILGADGRGRTALHVAAAQGNGETVCFLLKCGADVNAIDCNGETALQDAIRSGSLGAVELLISEGARLEKSPEDIGAEMCWCVKVCKRRNLTCYCIAHIACFQFNCSLAFLGDAEQMEAWKKAGVSFNTTNAQGQTPLHVAVCSDQMEMVKFCIRNGSDPEQRDKRNNRPADDAKRLGFLHLVELLARSEDPEQ